MVPNWARFQGNISLEIAYLKYYTTLDYAKAQVKQYITL